MEMFSGTQGSGLPVRTLREHCYQAPLIINLSHYVWPRYHNFKSGFEGFFTLEDRASDNNEMTTAEKRKPCHNRAQAVRCREDTVWETMTTSSRVGSATDDLTPLRFGFSAENEDN